MTTLAEWAAIDADDRIHVCVGAPWLDAEEPNDD